ncbi:MAG: nitronate monooxygenase, partial [Chromatiales bacterium]|nr:nitronate monooxygenase [Chromatiales bacterium]
MKSRLCDRFGIEFPLFAFSHCRDVIVEVTNAGGMGVLGAVGHTPESLEIELSWIDERVNGKPYGVDLLVPNKMEDKEAIAVSAAEIEARIPPEHRNYVNDLLASHGIDVADLWDGSVVDGFGDNMRAEGAAKVLDV